MKICTHPGHPYGQIFSELSEIDRISQERRYRVVFYWFTGVSDYNLQCPQTGGDDQKQKQNNKKMQLLKENTNKEGKIEKDNKETKQDLNIDKYDSSI